MAGKQGQSGRGVAQQGSAESSERAPHLDDLRRRLYRAGASEADVQRYVAERGAQADEQAPIATADEPPRRGIPRRRVVGAAVVVLAACTALVMAVQHDRPLVSTLAPSGSPSADVPAKQVRDIGDGEVLVVQEGAVSGPVAAATSVRGVAAVGQRFEGRGNAVVDLDPPAGALQGGRMMVVVTSSGTSPVGWRALLTIERSERPSPVVMARGRTQEPWGVSEPTTFVYPTRPPSRVAVEAPAGVPWTLLVAATNGIEPDLR